jgi:hypothetical protein
MQGSCLCGAIVYQVDSLDTPVRHCSCHTCRKAHAAAFNTGCGVKKEHFRWVQGEALLAHYESSPGKVRHFCSRCGSQLVAEKVGVPYMVLRLATLDDDPGVRPSAHIWTSHEVPWLSYGEDLPRCEEWPPGYPG